MTNPALAAVVVLFGIGGVCRRIRVAWPMLLFISPMTNVGYSICGIVAWKHYLSVFWLPCLTYSVHQIMTVLAVTSDKCVWLTMMTTLLRFPLPVVVGDKLTCLCVIRVLQVNLIPGRPETLMATTDRWRAEPLLLFVGNCPPCCLLIVTLGVFWPEHCCYVVHCLMRLFPNVIVLPLLPGDNIVALWWCLI